MRTIFYQKLLLIPSVLVIFVWLYRSWLYYRYGYESAKHLENQPHKSNISNIPTILLYSTLDKTWDHWAWEFPGPILACPGVDGLYNSLQCHISSDQAHLESAGAVMVSMADINSFLWTWLPPGLDQTRSKKGQLWALYFAEAPWFYSQRKLLDRESLSNLNGIFSWTISYRTDSDFQGGTMFPSPRDNCKWVKTSQEDTSMARASSTTDALSSKTELVVWIVSHCQTMSHREDYVSELQKFINVKIIGDCGTTGRDDNAWVKVKNAKFYLAFENSICDEYITEKYHRILSQYNTVPVVMGPKKSDYLAVSPPNSFIHVSDFSGGPQELANYLIHLDKSPSEYLAYLEWKTKYRAHCPDTWACRMCAALHSKSRPPIIKDFVEFWSGRSCYKDWKHSEKSYQ